MAFDRDEALECVDGDWELLREVVAIFRDEYPKILAEIRGAVLGRDAAMLAFATHKLKGLVRNFGARSAGKLALELEVIGKTGAFAGAGLALVSLEHEVERLGNQLDEFSGGPKQ